MIRINSVNIGIHHTEEELIKKLASVLRLKPEKIKGYKIIRKSIDARKKDCILYSYTIDADVMDEDRVLKIHSTSSAVSRASGEEYRLPECGEERLEFRPVIAGFGPAGIFAALSLARAGFKPIVIERGESVEERERTVSRFWESGELKADSNVSFGEGGAGTFSDGKLNTLVKDSKGRNKAVLRTLTEFGADGEIEYLQKPHIGTDRLKSIVAEIRKEIIRLGGEVRFNTRLDCIDTVNGRISSIRLSDGSLLQTDILILAIGHSARDTLEMLYKKDVNMEAKAFAVGIRIQHKQHMIDVSQYGEAEADFLSPAPYKLTAQVNDCFGNERGVYSFCMCPGGYVVNASTEDERLAVNGMSYHARDSKSANSAIIVTVRPEDFKAGGGEPEALCGIEFQRRLEESAYSFGKGKIPVQLLKDFMEGRDSESFQSVEPCFKGDTGFARVDRLLPDFISSSIKNAIPKFDRQIRGFADPEAIVAAVESRTSSPVRIKRGESLESNIAGLYPCGEGAGYAGGITSAAMDGLRTAEAVISRYYFEENA